MSVLADFKGQTKLSNAHPDVIKAVQAELNRIGYPLSVDGIAGPQTMAAFAQFKIAHHLAGLDLLGPTTAVELLEAPEADFTPATVARVTGNSLFNVESHLPAIIAALREQGIYSKLCLVAAIATIGTEVPNFCPIGEYGGNEYFTRMYEGRATLGNCEKGDGAKFHGRGFLQLTGRTNYCEYGKQLGVDLVNNPDLALDPQISARVLALYFKHRGVDVAANQQDWQRVRRLVNGGLNGWNRFSELVWALSKA